MVDDVTAFARCPRSASGVQPKITPAPPEGGAGGATQGGGSLCHCYQVAGTWYREQ